jgi:hypothetical protein
VPTDPQVQKEFDEAFSDVPHEIGGAGPAMSLEKFKKLVATARAKVLAKLEAKIAYKAAQRMSRITLVIFLISLGGVLLLAMPLFLRKKYPGKGGMLFKYSALAAVTWFVTVNLFGVVAVTFRTAQSAMGTLTNPQLKIAEGFFDSLDKNADELLVLGPSLLGPTLYQLQDGGDEQPTVALLENGQKLLTDAKVFVAIAKLFKKIDFVFALIPIVLLGLTLLFFVLAIKPTLIEIIKLPATVASGLGGGRDVVRGAVRRIGNEILATLCTIGVLFVMTVVSAAILGAVVQPALYTIIEFFGTAVIYLQMQAGASSGLVFVSLFGVILFLILNLAVLIVSIAFYLGKAQKVFQARFHDKVPMRGHARFWKWGTASIVLAHVVPLVFMIAASKLLDVIENKLIGDGTDIPWKMVMLVGPLLLVVGFLGVFWAARGFKAIKFLFGYKVKPAPVVPASTAEPVPPQ